MKMRHSQMVRRLCVFLPFCLFTLLPLSAQSFTQRLQQSAQGEGTVTIHQDKAIDNLVNGSSSAAPASKATPKANTPEKVAATPEKVATTPEKTIATPEKVVVTPAPIIVAQDDKKEKVEQKVEQKVEREPDTTSSQPDTSTVKKSGQVYKITGYRVQVFAGGNSRQDKRKAEQTGNQLRSLFPNEAIYTHFYPPRWICRMGNFRTYEEAYKVLEEVKKLGFTSATIVKGKVSVQY
ncbi:MAG: SPOR domain-containing protein [Prevotella sp.]|nr:SPOR domain-containing protein [Prevotella sp.]